MLPLDPLGRLNINPHLNVSTGERNHVNPLAGLEVTMEGMQQALQLGKVIQENKAVVNDALEGLGTAATHIGLSTESALGVATQVGTGVVNELSKKDAVARLEKGTLAVIKLVSALTLSPFYFGTQVISSLAGAAIMIASGFESEKIAEGWSLMKAPSVWMTNLVQSTLKDGYEAFTGKISDKKTLSPSEEHSLKATFNDMDAAISDIFKVGEGAGSIEKGLAAVSKLMIAWGAGSAPLVVSGLAGAAAMGSALYNGDSFTEAGSKGGHILASPAVAALALINSALKDAGIDTSTYGAAFLGRVVN